MSPYDRQLALLEMEADPTGHEGVGLTKLFDAFGFTGIVDMDFGQVLRHHPNWPRIGVVYSRSGPVGPVTVRNATSAIREVERLESL